MAPKSKFRRGGSRAIPSKKPQRAPLDVYEYEETSESHDPRRFDRVDSYEYELPEDFEDEEIDEDEAFNEDDRKRYAGINFESAPKPQKKHRKGQQPAAYEAEDDDDEDDDDDLEDGDFDVLEMFDRAASEDAKSKKKSTSKSQTSKKLRAGKAFGFDFESDDSDDDAERERGAASDGESDSDGDNEGLMRVVKSMGADRNAVERMRSVRETGGESVAARGGVDMEDLVAELPMDGKAAEELHAMLGESEKRGVSEGLSTHAQSSTSRTSAYASALTDVSRWSALVRRLHQTDGPDLQFPLVQTPKIGVSVNTLAAGVEVEEEGGEGEIEGVLRAAGVADEKAIREFEEETLRRQSPTSVQDRRSELSKLRHLCFEHEMRAKRLKKIKSKAFRKRRREREREREGDALGGVGMGDEAAAEEMERMERKRMEERLTLKHKNTSRWARRAIHRLKGASGEALREAINEQLRVGEELRRKMKSLDEEEDDSDSDDGADVGTTEEMRSALWAIRQELESTDTPSKSPAESSTKSPAESPAESCDSGKPAAAAKGLFGLKFMQRAAERKREEAKALLERLERVIEGGEMESEGEGDDDEEAEEEKSGAGREEGGRRRFGGDVDNEEEEKEPAKKRKRLIGGTDETSTPTLGVRVSAPLTVHTTHSNAPQTTAVHSQAIDGDLNQRDVSQISGKKAKITAESSDESSSAAEESDSADSDSDDSDSDDSESADSETEKPNKKSPSLSKGMSADGVLPLLGDSESDDSDAESADDAGPTQQQLIQQAFGLSGAESGGYTAADFREEKRREAEREVAKGEKEKDKVVMAGWGSWGGKGVKMGRKEKQQRREADKAHQHALTTALKSRADRNLSHVQINQRQDRTLGAKYCVQQLPHGFKTREQYERALATSVSREWNTAKTYKAAIRPRVEVTYGEVIQPPQFKKAFSREHIQSKDKQRKKRMSQGR